MRRRLGAPRFRDPANLGEVCQRVLGLSFPEVENAKVASSVHLAGTANLTAFTFSQVFLVHLCHISHCACILVPHELLDILNRNALTEQRGAICRRNV